MRWATGYVLYSLECEVVVRACLPFWLTHALAMLGRRKTTANGTSSFVISMVDVDEQFDSTSTTTLKTPQCKSMMVPELCNALFRSTCANTDHSFSGNHQQSAPMWKKYYWYLKNKPGFRVPPLSSLPGNWQLSSKIPYYPINSLDARWKKSKNFPVKNLPNKCLRGQGKMVGRAAWPKQLSDTAAIGTVGIKRLNALAQKSKQVGTNCGTP